MIAGFAAALWGVLPGVLTAVSADQVDRGSDPDLVAPGMSAFLAFFVLAMVVVFLGWSMTRQVRRSEYRNARRREEAAAAEVTAAESATEAAEREADPRQSGAGRQQTTPAADGSAAAVSEDGGTEPGDRGEVAP